MLVREVKREAGARDDSSSNAGGNAQLRYQKHPSDMKALAPIQLQTYRASFISVARHRTFSPRQKNK
jgi:hypothetical protein